MSEYDWSVYVEAAAPACDRADINEQAERAEELMDLLADWAAVPAADETSWSVELTVEASSPIDAARSAEDIVTNYAAKAGLLPWPLVRVEVVRSDVHVAALARSNFPDVVGSQEVTSMLQITRQRLHELRSAGRFPAPIVQLAATPVWARTAVEAFAETWDRRPGRPSLERSADRGTE
jgi:hypothetical protein